MAFLQAAAGSPSDRAARPSVRDCARTQEHDHRLRDAQSDCGAASLPRGRTQSEQSGFAHEEQRQR